MGIFKHFVENTGKDYSNWDLTNAVDKHPSTGRFKQDIADAFQKTINDGGDYFGDPDFSIKENLEGNPRFNESLDNINGLRISLNDIWSYDIKVVSFREINGRWEATIKLTLYDHFGLDSKDIADNPYANIFPAFNSWYILQWARGFQSFITVMNLPEFTISGPLPSK